jgi:hypothetical protein
VEIASHLVLVVSRLLLGLDVLFDLFELLHLLPAIETSEESVEQSTDDEDADSYKLVRIFGKIG